MSENRGNDKSGGRGKSDSTRDGRFVRRDDGTYLRSGDGREFHISRNPNAKGDDGTGNDSDGGWDDD
jgi:hypothetical protein